MEEKSQMDVNPTSVYLIVSVIILLLVGYFSYSILIKDKSSNENLGLVKDLSDSTVNSSASTSNKTIEFDECAELKGELKENCLLKKKKCTDDDCFYLQSRLTKNESNCLNIENRDRRVTCTSSIKYDTIIQSSIISQDISLCNQLEVVEVIQGCKDNYNYIQSIKTKDKSYCEKLSNTLLKDECLK